MSRKSLRTLAVCLVVGVVLVGGGVLAAYLLSPVLVKLALLPNNKVVDFHTYFSLDPEVATLIKEDTRITDEESPLYEAEEVYLPLAWVRQNFDPFIFWDNYAETLYVTNNSAMAAFTKDEVLVRDETVFVPASLLGRLYPYAIGYQTEYNIVTVDGVNSAPNMGRLLKDTNVRYRPDNASDVEVKAGKDTLLNLYAAEGDFTRVRMENGLLGYVLTEEISLLTVAEINAVEKPEMPEPLLGDYIVNTEITPPRWPEGENVNLVWEDVGSVDGNYTRMETPLPFGLNAVSPTWFQFNADIMAFDSIANEEYVSWAQNQGVQVWPRVFDLNGDTAHALLTDAGARAQAVAQLCNFITELNLDGLNVDFEHVREEDGDYFIQFLRELRVAMDDEVLSVRDTVLSVDVYVPQEWSKYYRRGDVALFADFLCVMAYDEHFQGSPESGPVASRGFVEEGIVNTLAEVPKEKILMGLPFYNRVWREFLNNDTPENRQTSHYGMEYTKTLLIENEVTPEWDAEAGYFYGEYAAVEEDETVLYRIWLEDENSIAEKLKIFEQYDLGGIAGWRRGFENAAVWQLINELR